MAQKFVAPNTIFDSSVAFLKQVSLNSTVKFDNVFLSTLDTSADGLSQLDTAIATSGAIKSYVDNKVISGVGAWNGLSETDTSIGLGGNLVENTTIDVGSFTFLVNSTASDGSTYFRVGPFNNELGTKDSNFSWNTVGEGEHRLAMQFYGAYDSEGVQSIEMDNSQTNGIGVTDAQESIGFTYAANYSTNGTSYGDRWVPDYGAVKAYVDASVVGSTANAWNGLSKTDNSIGLGGIVPEEAIITVEMYADFQIQNDDSSFRAAFSMSTPDASVTRLLVGNPDTSSGLVFEQSLDESLLYVQLKDLNNSLGFQMAPEQFPGIRVIDDINVSGLFYNSNYSFDGLIDHGDRWVPDYGAVKAYVDASVLAGGAEARNGLSKIDGSIGLGGIVGAKTTINIKDNADLNIFDNNSGFMGLSVGVVTGISVVTKAYLGDINDELGFRFKHDGSTGASTSMQMTSGIEIKQILMDEDASGITVNDEIDNVGFHYAANYATSALVTTGDRWIPDFGAVKAYVDASVVGSTANVWNGLSKTDNSIGLGGALVQDISIRVNGNQFTVATINDVAGFGLADAGAGNAVTYLGAPITGYGFGYASFFDGLIEEVKMRMAVKSIIMNKGGDPIQIEDGDGSVGMVYTQDYSANGTSNPRWIPDYGAVKAYVDSSIGTNFVKKTGDTMTGPLTITGGGLQVGEIGTPQDVSIYSQLYVHNGATIGGDLTIDGSLFVRSVETIDVSGAFIQLNTGQTGTPPASMQSGIVIDRGDEIPYVFLYDESNQSFRIGIAPVSAGPSYDDASTQSVATREDTPTLNGIGFWNSSLSRIDTDASLVFNPATGLTLGGPAITVNNLTADNAEFTGVLIDGANKLVTKEFGTGAFATIANFATIAYVDASLVTRDGSITALFDENDVQDTLIANNDTSISANWTLINTNISNIGILDSSVSALETSIQDLSTGKIDAVASTTSGPTGHEVYSAEADNVAYIKRLVAGNGATMISDSSTITISVTGEAGYMSKYTDTFSADGSTSFTVTQATHLISNTDFALSVAVFEGTVQVFPEIDVDAGGDVTITWSSGALSGTGKFIISG